jgi:hypothetical protein
MVEFLPQDRLLIGCEQAVGLHRGRVESRLAGKAWHD